MKKKKPNYTPLYIFVGVVFIICWIFVFSTFNQEPEFKIYKEECEENNAIVTYYLDSEAKLEASKIYSYEVLSEHNHELNLFFNNTDNWDTLINYDSDWVMVKLNSTLRNCEQVEIDEVEIKKMQGEMPLENKYYFSGGCDVDSIILVGEEVEANIFECTLEKDGVIDYGKPYALYKIPKKDLTTQWLSENCERTKGRKTIEICVPETWRCKNKGSYSLPLGFKCGEYTVEVIK